MFRNNKGLKRPEADNAPHHGRVSVPEIQLAGGIGPGKTMMSGTSAAWTKSFARDHFDTKQELPAQEGSSDDLLANVDQDLLNPSVDEAAWAAPWYFEKIANSKVSRLLKDKPDGAFIIRDSSSQPGCFAMSYRFLNRTHHSLINSGSKGIHLAKSTEIFTCLSDLVKRYSINFERKGDDLPCPLRTDVELSPSDGDASHAVQQQQQQQQPEQGEGKRKGQHLEAVPEEEQQQQKQQQLPLQQRRHKSNQGAQQGALGGVLTIDTGAGQGVPQDSAVASPAVPSRRTKPTPNGVQAEEEAPSETSANGIKTAIKLCPHCSSQQSTANMVCSSCNKSLHIGGPMRHRCEAMSYTEMVPRTRLRKQQQHEEAKELAEGDESTSSKDSEEEQEATEDKAATASGDGDGMADGAQRDDDASSAATDPAGQGVEAAGDSKGLKDNGTGSNDDKKKKDKDKKAKKKKVKKKRKNALEIVVDPLPENVDSILLPPNSPKKLGVAVRFDEGNITKTAADMAFFRGAAGRVDDLAWDCSYYLDDMIARPEQAASKLTGSEPGTFVVYEHTGGEDALMLSVVGKDNGVLHYTVTHGYEGLQLEDQGPHFQDLSSFVQHYSTAPEGCEPLLQLSQAQRDLIERVTETTDGVIPRKRRVTTDLGDPQQAERGHKGPYNKMSAPDHLSQPWYHGELSRVEAVAMVEFEPCGTFVVRDNFDEPGRYILTYVYDSGELGHVEIKPYGDGFALEEEGAIERPTICDLVAFYASDAGQATGHLPTKLRLPKAGQHARQQQQPEPEPQPQPPLPAKITSPPPPRQQQGQQTSPVPGGRESIGRFAAHVTAERPPWLQTNMPKAQALQPIATLDDGAFVIRSSETRKQCYVLSYKFHQQVHHELIKHTPQPNARFFLSRNPNQTFGSLSELVEHFQTPTQELKYPLVPGYLTSSESTTPAAAVQEPRRSSRPSVRGSSVPEGKPPLLRQISRNRGLMATEEARANASATATLQAHGSSRGFTRSQSSRRSRHRESFFKPRTGQRLDQRAATSHWCCLNVSKEEAMSKLPRKEGAFIVRRASNYFATLTVMSNGKPHHFHIEDTTQGLRLKKSTSFQPNLSALIAFYKIPTQTDLPRCIVSW